MYTARCPPHMYEVGLVTSTCSSANDSHSHIRQGPGVSISAVLLFPCRVTSRIASASRDRYLLRYAEISQVPVLFIEHDDGYYIIA